jgi:hypothetical protein
VFGGERLGAVTIAGGYRCHHDLGVIAGRFDERRRCDTCSSQDTDPHRGVGSRHRRDASSKRRTARRDRSGTGSVRSEIPSVSANLWRYHGTACWEFPAISYVGVCTDS